ncbi:MAG TPA: amidoligase family protein [Rhizomicrobium sp.]
MLSWKMGFEIELMAPAGRSRADLAARVARRHGGTVRRFFHPQSEPALVPGQPVFENLTLGFEALDARGARIAAFVDDLTLQGGLDRQARPKAGWYRVVADDARLLRLAMRHCDAAAPLATLLDPLAALFGTAPQRQANGMVRIVDGRGASVAIGAPLPGERERPCEIVTAPIATDHERVL